MQAVIACYEHACLKITLLMSLSSGLQFERMKTSLKVLTSLENERKQVAVKGRGAHIFVKTTTSKMEKKKKKQKTSTALTYCLRVFIFSISSPSTSYLHRLPLHVLSDVLNPKAPI